MPLATGTRLGTYEVIAPLGAGGMGEVYRAKDMRLGRSVAIKVLPSQVAASAERLARFEREARTVAGLNHPNIVTLHSVEDEDGVRFLTMELVEGQPLDRLVAPAGLPVARILDLSIPIASALIAAHERGVVHRDLKPSNVMVTPDGWVKVLDFGLAKTALGANDPRHDATTIAATEPISLEGHVLGTVPYMAPEQIRAEAVDGRSDLFAFGIMLYALATGRRPFTGSTSPDISSSILRDAAAPAVQLRVDLPRDLNRLIARCLEKDPRDRIQTARDVYNELRLIQREIGTAVSGATAAGGAAAQPAARTAASTPPTQWPDGASASVSGAPRHATSPRDTPSIAVLPFVNRSRGDEDEYFSDGLADELLNVLTKIQGLRVAARASSFRFRDKDVELATIGEKLNVATLLDGSVRKAGNRVRISVQLVKAADSVQLWSETYDRSLDDIFAVQDDIAQAVVKELRTTLLGDSADSDASARAKADVAAAVLGHGENPEAHRLYLQGKYFVDRITEVDLMRGIQSLEQALALDDTHAAAWSTLARAHITCGGFGWEPVLDAFRSARAAATRALELAPNLAEAHAAMCSIQRWHDWDWRGAEQSARRAVELAPENSEALRSYGWLLVHVGKYSESEAVILRSIQNDPLNAEGFVGLGVLYRCIPRPADAERALRTAIELTPQGVHTRYVLAFLLAEQGRHEEALAVAAEEPATWGRLTALAFVHHKAGRIAEADAALRELEATSATSSAFQIAELYAARGESDSAFAWLERAFAQRDPGMAWLKRDPPFVSIHRDPRWSAMLKKMGFAD